MKNRILSTLLSLLIANFLFAQNEIATVFEENPQTDVRVVKVKPNGTVNYQGNLSQGQKLSDLRWASRSSVACFPGTQNKKFTGNHVFFSTTIPKRSEMFIKVIPKNKSQNFSLYAYQVGLNNNQLPPNLGGCVSCEADHKWDYKKRGKTQDHTRKVRLNAINNPYKVVIGVVGAEGLSSGAFTLEIKLVGGESGPKKTTNIKVQKITAKGAVTSVNGNLKTGDFMYDLSWASRSSVACFPGTQNKKFRGKHVLYEVIQPKYSNMIITVIPKDKSKNLSLYAYSVGTNSTAVVPNLGSCVSCEADHKWDYKKKGKTQDHTRSVKMTAINNPYKIYIGVAGADKLDDADFELKIEIRKR